MSSVTFNRGAVTAEKGDFLTLKGGSMKYIKVILTVIAVLLALNVLSRCFVTPVTAQTGVQDVNIVSVYDLRLNPLLVDIVD